MFIKTVRVSMFERGVSVKVFDQRTEVAPIEESPESNPGLSSHSFNYTHMEIFTMNNMYLAFAKALAATPEHTKLTGKVFRALRANARYQQRRG